MSSPAIAPPITFTLAPVAAPAESGFYAVRQGVGVRACIFLQWSDCWWHLQYAGVDYKVFDNVDDALKYIQVGSTVTVGNDNSSTASATPVVPGAASGAASASKSPLLIPTITNTAASATATRCSPDKKRKAAATTPSPKRSRIIPLPPTTYGTMHYPSVDPLPLRNQHEEKKEKKRLEWELKFSKLKSYSEALARGVGPTMLPKSVTVFTKELQEEYNKYDGGDALSSTLTEERITRLQAIGFVFVSEWEKSFNAFKAYREANNGVWVQTDKVNDASLRRWMTDMERQYWRFHQGEEHFALTQQRIDRLKAAGFQFEYISWTDRIEQLKRFKSEHGHFNVPEGDDGLGAWLKKLHQQYSDRVRLGKPSKYLTAPRLAELAELGLYLTKQNIKLSKKDLKKAKRQEAFDVEFNTMLPKLQRYRRVHGDCKVSREGRHKELGDWLHRQRVEFRKLRKDDETCRTTANHIQQLTDAGFQLAVRKKVADWEERFQELLVFKAEHGHTIVPQATPGLGFWVHRQRKDMRKFRIGETSAMTEDRASRLRQIGFVVDDAKGEKKKLSLHATYP